MIQDVVFEYFENDLNKYNHPSCVSFYESWKVADYVLALVILWKILKKNSLPDVTLNNCELGMINAIHELFPTTSIFFFR